MRQGCVVSGEDHGLLVAGTLETQKETLSVEETTVESSIRPLDEEGDEIP